MCCVVQTWSSGVGADALRETVCICQLPQTRVGCHGSQETAGLHHRRLHSPAPLSRQRREGGASYSAEVRVGVCSSAVNIFIVTTHSTIITTLIITTRIITTPIITTQSILHLIPPILTLHSLSLPPPSPRPKSKRTASTASVEECHFWRSSGCSYGDQCRYLHLPESKGVDAAGGE